MRPGDVHGLTFPSNAIVVKSSLSNPAEENTIHKVKQETCQLLLSTRKFNIVPPVHDGDHNTCEVMT